MVYNSLQRSNMVATSSSIEELNNALDENPYENTIRLMMADAYEELGEYQRALGYRKLVEHNCVPYKYFGIRDYAYYSWIQDSLEDDRSYLPWRWRLGRGRTLQSQRDMLWKRRWKYSSRRLAEDRAADVYPGEGIVVVYGENIQVCRHWMNSFGIQNRDINFVTKKGMENTLHWPRLLNMLIIPYDNLTKEEILAWDNMYDRRITSIWQVINENTGETSRIR